MTGNVGPVPKHEVRGETPGLRSTARPACRAEARRAAPPGRAITWPRGGAAGGAGNSGRAGRERRREAAGRAHFLRGTGAGAAETKRPGVGADRAVRRGSLCPSPVTLGALPSRFSHTETFGGGTGRARRPELRPLVGSGAVGLRAGPGQRGFRERPWAGVGPPVRPWRFGDLGGGRAGPGKVRASFDVCAEFAGRLRPARGGPRKLGLPAWFLGAAPLLFLRFGSGRPPSGRGAGPPLRFALPAVGRRPRARADEAAVRPAALCSPSAGRRCPLLSELPIRDPRAPPRFALTACLRSARGLVPAPGLPARGVAAVVGLSRSFPSSQFPFFLNIFFPPFLFSWDGAERPEPFLELQLLPVFFLHGEEEEVWRLCWLHPFQCTALGEASLHTLPSSALGPGCWEVILCLNGVKTSLPHGTCGLWVWFDLSLGAEYLVALVSPS